MGRLAIRLCEVDESGIFQKPKYGCVNRFGIFKPGIFIKKN